MNDFIAVQAVFTLERIEVRNRSNIVVSVLAFKQDLNTNSIVGIRKNK